MSKIYTYVTRGKNTECVHEVKCLIKNIKNETIFSTNNLHDVIFPRSSIKIFQAIPFITSRADKIFKLNQKQIALACASHTGQNFHILQLSSWVDKLKINKENLQCGIHSPINSESTNKLLLSGNQPNQLHNNCAGKHLAMLSSSIVNCYKINDYLDLNHPHQIKIREILKNFTESNIVKTNYGVDGCSAPQYAFTINNLSTALINLIKSFKKKDLYTSEIRTLVASILCNPNMIGGSYRFDTDLIKIFNSNLFCKGGAEGVFLFAHLKKNIVGVIKVKDGNERAIPSTVFQLFKKLKIATKQESAKLKRWEEIKIKNHAKTITGKIYSIIKT